MIKTSEILIKPKEESIKNKDLFFYSGLEREMTREKKIPSRKISHGLNRTCWRARQDFCRPILMKRDPLENFLPGLKGGIENFAINLLEGSKVLPREARE